MHLPSTVKAKASAVVAHAALHAKALRHVTQPLPLALKRVTMVLAHPVVSKMAKSAAVAKALTVRASAPRVTTLVALMPKVVTKAKHLVPHANLASNVSHASPANPVNPTAVTTSTALTTSLHVLTHTWAPKQAIRCRALREAMQAVNLTPPAPALI